MPEAIPPIKARDIIYIDSITNTKNSIGVDESGEMAKMVGQHYSVVEYVADKGLVAVYGLRGKYYFERNDVTLSWSIGSAKPATGMSLNIPQAFQMHDRLLNEYIGLTADLLRGLHNTEVYRKSRLTEQRYDGSGQLRVDKTISRILNKTRLELAQTKKTGLLRDKPDVIILLDTSGSIDNLHNHTRIIAGAISDVFFADINSICLIPFNDKADVRVYNDKQDFYAGLQALVSYGGTNYIDALIKLFNSGMLNSNVTKPKLVLLITDGVPEEINAAVEGAIVAGETGGADDNQSYLTDLHLLQAIDAISTLSALSNTVFRIYLISNSTDSDAVFERIADRMLLLMSRTETKDKRILIKRYISEIIKNGRVLGTPDFITGAVFNKVVNDIQSEFYKLIAMR